MFEAFEAGSEIQKAEYEAIVPELREQLLDAQFELQKAPFSMLVIVVGDDLHGAEAVIDLLNEWLDARYVRTEAFERPSDEERERPPFWRFSRAMAPRGRTGLFRGAWFLQAIADLLQGRIDGDQLPSRLEHMRRQERMLAADGTLILKFWLHLPKKEHKRRLRKGKKNGERAWLSTEADALVAKDYDEVTEIAAGMIRATDTAYAPWHVIESTDRRHRDVTVGKTILHALRERLSGTTPAQDPPSALAAAQGPGALERVDLSATITEEEYDERLASAQEKLVRLQRKARGEGRSTVLVFEGWDAAGKGGAIRRITRVLPASEYSVVSIAAPTDEERAQHYLWRFWRHVPRAGRMAIFDRSWYGRVLVERVEGFARPDEWARAYEEIVDFETQLVEHGTLLLKFWLHIDPDEQLRRFQAREQTGYKRYKITDEDYRNREKWPDYVRAVDDLVVRTSTDLAPWLLLPANDKRVARVEVLESLCKAMKKRLA